VYALASFMYGIPFSAGSTQPRLRGRVPVAATRVLIFSLQIVTGWLGTGSSIRHRDEYERDDEAQKNTHIFFFGFFCFLFFLFFLFSF
jgi:hypothetical protein